MKKKTAYLLLGIFLTTTVLGGCGKNEATEAASESAQTEKEGAGEDELTETPTPEAKSDKETDKQKSSKETETSDSDNEDRDGGDNGRPPERRSPFFFQTRRNGAEMQMSSKAHLRTMDMNR